MPYHPIWKYYTRNIWKNRLLFLVLFFLISCSNKLQQSPMVLWFDKPASQSDTIPYDDNRIIEVWSGNANGWREALPVGNGRLGAMVFGGVQHERIQLNENSLWGGYKRNANNPLAIENLEKIRQLIFLGKNDEATALAERSLIGMPSTIESYQTLGDLMMVDLHSDTLYSGYHRALDIENALASVTYKKNKVHYSREIFASAPDQIVCMRLVSSVKGGLNHRFSLIREKDAQVQATNQDGNLYLKQFGQISSFDSIADLNRGMKFETSIKFENKGGKVDVKNGSVTITNADEITLYIASATNYRGVDPETLNRLTFSAIEGKSFFQIRQDHIADYKQLFSRVKINIGSTDIPQKPLNELMADAKKGELIPYLSELVFQYGRYLLISSSRAGGLPNNLQGIWNQHVKAPWNSDYHININLQMNYWPAEVTNLSECHQPLFGLIDSLAKYGSIAAKETYGCHGWFAHHVTDPFWRIAPVDGTQGIWPMGGAWLCRHLWEHYEYTQDVAFLREKAYPLMKTAAEFFFDFLIEIPDGMPFQGKLITNPSHSPENAFEKPDGSQSMFTYGATMDIQIITDLLTNCIKASEILQKLGGNEDGEFVIRLKSTLDKLTPLQISAETGKIQEWIEDYKEIELGHRHISHLYGLFPGQLITNTNTPFLAQAATKTLEGRLKGNPNAAIEEAHNKYPSFDSYLNGNGGGNWQRAWLSACWARLGEGEMAYDSHKKQIAQVLSPNLTGDVVSQLDGSFGATAAMAEMLMQSHEGFINILPALPKAWKNGYINGLRARGGFILAMVWENNKIKKISITSEHGLPCKLYIGAQIPQKVKSISGNIDFKVFEGNMIEFETEKELKYTIEF
jgi:alpha-L-fucosidase 2